MQELQTSPLLTEWTTLQNQHDGFEKLSLLIKLCAIFVSATLLLDLKHPQLVLFFNIIFWVQDAIWKTFQSRFAERLLSIEQELLQNKRASVRFNSEWESKPRGTANLVCEYLRHLVKPTVVFPHILLFFLSLYVLVLV